ncbi:hypothetical protein ENSA5_15020 [Enhygromyxa salina]|uniref:Uncharacterized protein n=1 Tax=Enhygromyxa salina TaxID=215803 RepID=A0A2S9YEL8_9BACT|nr:hypothetical protein [Enhygromyxa salina]PRQ03472.1 hypothetical protein ENSA5_15020 [Enhygromyxa salina]
MCELAPQHDLDGTFEIQVAEQVVEMMPGDRTTLRPATGEFAWEVIIDQATWWWFSGAHYPSCRLAPRRREGLHHGLLGPSSTRRAAPASARLVPGHWASPATG